MSNSDNLRKAKKAKNDEFYTLYEDIEKELIHYKPYLRGKKVYCNCDNPNWSNFWKYLHEHFEEYGLRKLTATFLAQENEDAFIAEYEGGRDNDIHCWKQTTLNGTGGFETEECKTIMERNDIIITNPPFSLWRRFFKQIIDFGKDLLILGNMNAVSYKEVFPYIKENKLSVGYAVNKTFIYEMPNDYELKGGAFEKDGKKFAKVPSSTWFTTLPVIRDVNLLKELSCKYYGNEDKYPKYDNYDAINVDKVKDIPIDYDGVMGVPITFLAKYDTGFEIIKNSEYLVSPYARLLIKKNPEFEIIGLSGSGELGKQIGIGAPSKEHKQKNKSLREGSCYIIEEDGKPKKVYNRILIKRTKEEVM